MDGRRLGRRRVARYHLYAPQGSNPVLADWPQAGRLLTRLSLVLDRPPRPVRADAAVDAARCRWLRAVAPLALLPRALAHRSNPEPNPNPNSNPNPTPNPDPDPNLNPNLTLTLTLTLPLPLILPLTRCPRPPPPTPYP